MQYSNRFEQPLEGTEMKIEKFQSELSHVEELTSPLFVQQHLSMY